MRVLLAIALLVVGATAQSTRQRPVTKVIKLIEKMVSELHADAEKDQEIFDNLECWCKTNRKEKKESMANAEASITQLSNDVNSHAAKKAERDANMKQTAKELKAAQESLAEATAIREKAATAYYEENKELIKNVEVLKNVIVVLGKHHEPPKAALLHIATVMRHMMYNNADRLEHMNDDHKKAVMVFVQAPGSQSYGSRSGAIFGIIQDMKDNFEADLKDAKAKEDAAIEAFGEFRSTSEEFITASKETYATLKQQHAEADTKLANDKEELDSTRQQLDADTKFLTELELQCDQADEEFQKRIAMRNEEILGCQDAIKILNDDDARDLFNKSVNTNRPVVSLLQTSRTDRKMEAAMFLQKYALKAGNSQIMALALTAKAVSFDKVFEAIDKLMAELKKEEAEEVKQKGWCQKELNVNEKDVQTNTRQAQEQQRKIEKLTAEMETLTAEIAENNKEIAETEQEKLKASEQREQENAEFQTQVNEQRQTQVILQKAIDRLAQVYRKEGFVQKENIGAPATPTAGDYKQNAGASGVLVLLEKVVQESQDVETEAMSAEQSAQAAYEEFISNSNAAIEACQNTVAQKTERKGNSGEEKANTEEDLTSTNDVLAQLSDYNTNLHAKCDFLLKNFDIRSAARTDELEAMSKAKAILKGSAQS